MKKVLISFLGLLLALLLTAPAYADRRDHGRSQGHADRDRGHEHFAPPEQRQVRHGGDDYYDRGHDRDYEYRNPERHPHGYSRQPYRREMGPHHFRPEHEYHYEGHWRSWDNWENYREAHPHRYHDGRYFREDSHLYFGFCDPAGGSCFYFSIGR